MRLLKHKLPWVKYESERKKFISLKKEKSELNSQLNEASERNRPLQNRINALQEEKHEVKNSMQSVEQAYANALNKSNELSKKAIDHVRVVEQQQYNMKSDNSVGE